MRKQGKKPSLKMLKERSLHSAELEWMDSSTVPTERAKFLFPYRCEKILVKKNLLTPIWKKLFAPPGASTYIL